MTPYRTAPAMERPPPPTAKQIFERGREAMARLNKGCPNAIAIEPQKISRFEYERKVRYYHHGPMVAKHSIRHIVSFPEHWREPCCKKPIGDFLAAECLSGWYGLKWRLAKRRLLQIQMFQGVVTREDFENLLVELRGLDELVQDDPYYLRWRRARLHVRARRAFRRWLHKVSSRRPRTPRLGLPGGDGPVSNLRDP